MRGVLRVRVCRVCVCVPWDDVKSTSRAHVSRVSTAGCLGVRGEQCRWTPLECVLLFHIVLTHHCVPLHAHDTLIACFEN